LQTQHEGSVGSAQASSLVKIGHTTVIAAVKAEVGIPSENTPNRGHIGTGMLLVFDNGCPSN